MKNVQIPQELLYDLFRYFLVLPDENTKDRIKTALEGKFEAMMRHDMYTQYQTAKTPEERETMRQAYLDRVGIQDSFRWGTEYEERRKQK